MTVNAGKNSSSPILADAMYRMPHLIEIGLFPCPQLDEVEKSSVEVKSSEVRHRTVEISHVNSIPAESAIATTAP